MSEKVLISVFAKMRRKFLRMAMHILPDEDDAADALQDAFCRLWPRRDNINTNAEAEAETIRIKAQAEAEANRIVSESLSPEVIENKKIEKWDGKLPQVQGDADPLITIN